MDTLYYDVYILIFKFIDYESFNESTIFDYFSIRLRILEIQNKILRNLNPLLYVEEHRVDK